ncbi:MAG: ATP-binding protein [Clostridia bacterium]|nr:ATP-binding protein [Clostridia bacterium]
MTKKIFHSILLVAGAVLLASLFVITGALYEYFGIIQKKQLKDELGLAAVSVEQQGDDFLKRLSPDHYRITWINTQGNVIYDTRTDAESLENHADRTEIKQALKDGYGESIRYSSTLLEKTIYCAQRLTDGSVLRISVSRATIGVLMLGILQPILIVLIVALVLSGMLAKRLSKRIVEPLNSLDLEHPLDNDSYEELSPLLNRINRQHNQITAQMRELKKRTDQFAQITASMNEGLVLLDNRGCILSINPAAIEIFGAEPSCVGQDFLSVDRSHDMSVAIQAALKDGHSEIHASRKGLIYQFDISRIAADGETAGVVILAFDITEKETAEQNRREFTANVSHELKTPLQGIIGSAELIENGMVKPEDMSRFVGHIRLEAQRLVTLIGDIIRLSQLDEGGDMPRENIDLLSVASAVADDLLPSADGQGISIAVKGSPANVYGVKRLLYEIVYNLCDNAIKYNRQGGSVKISTVSEGGFSSVTVSDTGIGIAPEYQNRIFERFFRVDKSHSKSSGGTGLGLSIVKHAVQYHHGKIELTSAPGKGTSITVSFPAIQ